jgi:UDP-N-acetyl-D-mannosaminuronic acid transferase (WecB/TagA/CpsF family)
MAIKIIKFLDIKFYNMNYSQVKKKLFQKKGYLVIPAASALSSVYLKKNYYYLNALRKSTVSIFDSGLFCLCLLFIKFIKVKKFSGHKFIHDFLSDATIKSKKILILNSNKKEEKLSKILLNAKKFELIKNYICPVYNPKLIYDKILIKIINNYKPEVVIINISGGVQEPLALYLKKNTKIKFISICSGAALGFFSGMHAPITKLEDLLYLGWLSRIIHNPYVFIPRLTKSLLLLFIVFLNPVTIVKK